MGRVVRGAATGADYAVRAYDARNGTSLWQSIYDEAGESDEARAVAIHRGRAIVAGEIKDANFDTAWLVRAYEVNAGDMEWEDRYDPSGRGLPNDVTGHRRWAYVCGQAIPAADNGATVEPSVDFVVRAYDVASGDLAWDDVFDPAGGFDSCSAVAAHRGRVFAAGSVKPDQETFNSIATVRAYDARTGELLWDHTLEGGDLGGGVFDIAVDNDGVYAVGVVRNDSDDSDWQVYALDPATGTELWSDQFDRAGGRDAALRVTSRKGRVYVAGSSIPSEAEGAIIEWTVRAYASQ